MRLREATIAVGAAAVLVLGPSAVTQMTVADAAPSTGKSKDHNRVGPDRGPNKSVPGGTNNDNHQRHGAEPDRNPRKFRPGDIGDPTPRTVPDRSRNRSKPRSQSPSEPNSPRVQPYSNGPETTQEPDTPRTPHRSPQDEQAPSTPRQQPTQPSRPRSAPDVDARSVGGTPDLPGSVIQCSNSSGCARGGPSSGTTRVFDIDPAQNGPFRDDPRTTSRTIDPDANTGATGPWSQNRISGNPITGGGAEVPFKEPGTTVDTPRGPIKVPGKGGGVELGADSYVQLRVVRAVPDKTYPVTTFGNPNTAVHYRYDYEYRTRYVGKLGGAPTLGPYDTKWSPIDQAGVERLQKQGVPLPAIR